MRFLARYPFTFMNHTWPEYTHLARGASRLLSTAPDPTRFLSTRASRSLTRAPVDPRGGSSRVLSPPHGDAHTAQRPRGQIRSNAPSDVVRTDLRGQRRRRGVIVAALLLPVCMIWGGDVGGFFGASGVGFWEDLLGRWRGLGWRGVGTPIQLNESRA